MTYSQQLKFTIFTTVGGIVLILGAAFWYDSYDNAKWQEFAQAHECRLVGHKDQSYGYGLTSNGKMGTIFIPETNTYRCNNGIDYTR